jgi:hypothetical protein
VFIAMKVLDFAVDVVKNSASSRKRFACQPKDVSTNCSLYRCDLSCMLWYEDKGRLRPVTCHEDTGKGGGVVNLAVLILKLGAIWK